MKTLSDRIEAVRSWVAPHIREVPGSASVVMELDAIAHELQNGGDVAEKLRAELAEVRRERDQVLAMAERSSR